MGKADGEGPAVIDHMLHIIDGDVPTFKDGELTLVPGMSGQDEEKVSFKGHPEPYSSVHIGHPEPITLSRSLKGIRNVSCKFAAEDELLGFFAAIKSLGLTSKEPISIKGQMVSPRDVAVTLLSMAEEQVDADTPPSSNLIRVTGIRDNNRSVFEFAGQGDMADATSIPAAIGIEMIADGLLEGTGVLPPEVCVEPDYFLEKLFSVDDADLNMVISES